MSQTVSNSEQQLNGYTIERKHGCTVVYGCVPMRQMIELLQQFEDDEIVDSQLCLGLGAHMVVGRREALDLMRSDPEVVAQIEQRVAGVVAGHEISSAARRWLSKGNRGMSSDAMFMHLTGVPVADDPMAYPGDPSDLGRCRLLIEQVPELAGDLSKMCEVSPYWGALASRWDGLCGLMDTEAPLWREGKGSCPETFKAMELLYESIHCQ